MLTVPSPVLKQKKVASTQFTSDQAIELECAPVSFPDGEALSLERMVRAAYWIQRHPGGGIVEVWNEVTKQWELSPTPPEPQPLFLKDNMWKALLVPVGQKDQAENDKFATVSATGFPQYSAKCVFKGRDGQGQEHEGVSPNSIAVRIRPLGEEQKASLFIIPKDNPSAATSIGLVLKDVGLVTERGRIAITEEAGGVRIELVGAGAQIQIRPSGAIILTPTPGESVRVVGNLQVDGVVTAVGYLP
jgi:hypothetical protein